MVPIVKKIIGFNNPKIPLQVRGAIIHETANTSIADSAMTEQQYFDSADRGASAHAFVDASQIVQCIDWDMKAWHAGATANRFYWGIEMCHTQSPVVFKNIWNNTVDLFAFLFTKVAYPKITNVTTENLMSHAEVSEKWRETDHMDPISYFAEFGKTVDDFRKDVQIKINTILFNMAVTNRNLCSTPEYWIINAKNDRKVMGSYMHQLILNFASMFIALPSAEEGGFLVAVDYLKKSGIIIDTDYWATHAQAGDAVDGAYAYVVLVGMGRYL
jgi:hypothetical protein